MAIFRDLMEIEDFLAERGGDEAMVLEELDGFLTALAILPVSARPPNWRNYIWNPRGDPPQGSLFRNETEARRINQLITELHGRIEYYLGQGGEFMPGFDYDEETDEPLWEGWVAGFTQGIRVAPESWKQIADAEDEIVNRAFAVFVALQSIIEGNSDLPEDRQDALAADGPALIQAAVITFYAAARPIWEDGGWIGGRGLEEVPSAVRKVGRNEPCPCGSGKKYKQCHGA